MPLAEAAASYVAGANTVANGQTFVKIGWNPVSMEDPSTMSVKQSFGVRIECDKNAGCNGLPCSIDPSKGNWNDVESPNAAIGAGGAAFCVVTVSAGLFSAAVRATTTRTTGN